MTYHLEWFWIWWGVTLLACGVVLLRGLVTKQEWLGVPFVCGMLWLYLYVYLPQQVAVHLNGVVPNDVLPFAQFLSCASLLALLAGWMWRQRREQTPAMRSAVAYDLERLWRWGLGWLIIGKAAQVAFQLTGQSVETASGYWYQFYNVGFAGMAMCSMVVARRRIDVGGWIALVGLSAWTVMPYLAGARRGPTFVSLVGVAFAYLLAHRRRLNPIWSFATLAGAGVLMLALVEARNYVYRGGTWGDAFERMTVRDVFENKARTTGDNEFVNHCVQIQANVETGLYQYGTTHLAMLVHWIPRQLWPDKPNRSEGLLPQARRQFVTPIETNLGSGGAWGAVADNFDNYWHFGLLVWFACGWASASLFRRAIEGDDLCWKMHYVGLLMSLHWAIAQSFSEALVPGLFFQAAFVVACWHARMRRSVVMPVMPAARREVLA